MFSKGGSNVTAKQIDLPFGSFKKCNRTFLREDLDGTDEETS